jgi:hypothetical protein
LWALTLVIAMQTRSASVSPRPVAWAAQSPRPAACSSSPGLWELSRQAQVERRCRELGRAQALLERAPEQALARATALLTEDPELGQARILHARASLRVGNTRAALAELAPLLDAQVGALVDPGTLQDGGRAALREGDLATAVRFYRRLGGGAALLPERRQQLVAYIEIAAALLTQQDGRGEGAVEALAYLREARRRSAGTGYTSLVVFLTADALLAQGRQAEGLGALGELKDQGEPERSASRGEAWLASTLVPAIRERIRAAKARPASKR